MAEPEYTALDWQLSDAELEQLPPSALRLIVRKLLTHIIGQDQRIKELEAEVNQLRVRLDRNSANSNKPPSSDSPYQENAPKPNKSKPGDSKATRATASSSCRRPGPRRSIPARVPADATRLRRCDPITPTSISSCPRS